MEKDKSLSHADKLYIKTFNSLTSNPDPAFLANTYRRLAVQLGTNIVHNDWEPLTSFALMGDYIKAASNLVDDQKCLNNYADQCLNDVGKFTNHSSKWESKLSIEDPDIQSLIQVHNDMGTREVEDYSWRRCMKIEVGEERSNSLNRSVVGRSNTVNTTKNVSDASLKEKIVESDISRDGGCTDINMSSKTEWETRPSNHASIDSDNGTSTFDLMDSDFLELLEPGEGVEPPKPCTSFSFKGKTSTTVKSENSLTTVGSSWSNNVIMPSFFQSKCSKDDNDSTRQTISRSSSIPPRSSFQQKFLPPKPAAIVSAPSYPRQTNASNPKQVVGGFKTAGQQLAIDRAKEGITQSSYGSGKKSLGTRPGPAGGFKPPVRNGDVGIGHHGDTSGIDLCVNNESGNGEDIDPRYKNIDMKMVELIKNEIMDSGEPVNWDDIAGLEFAKEMVKEIVVWPLLRPDIFTGLRGPPKGLLLFGPPGTGKTLIGKCIACQSGSTFFSISASSLTSKWVGDGEKMVRALFAVAKVHQPSVVFIDEIDSLLTSRSEGEHESSRKIKTEFLVQLDGASTGGEERVLVVGATNRPQELDEAARRRLVKRLYIPLPEIEARTSIITNLLGKENHNLSEEEVMKVSKLTEGYSGADMANLCKEAAMGPIRSLDFSQIASVRPDQVRPILHKDLIAALKQVKASVGQQDLQMYLEWDKQYGASR